MIFGASNYGGCASNSVCGHFQKRGAMKCLVLLMIEPEQPEALSARKLVVETEKHNVITAYNTDTGLDLLRRFPNVDAVIVHAHCILEHPDLLKTIKSIVPITPLVVACPNGTKAPPEADFTVDSHRPDAMVQLLAGPLQGSIGN
jgi:hypothetical protein